MRLLYKCLLASFSVAALVLAHSGPAEACGGTFCDSGPRAMPVDQTGENVLFVLDGESVEAHVQIQYRGDPARFAWIVPMPKVPSVSIGSQLLFDELLRSTVPSYGLTPRPDCSRGTGGTGGGGGSGGFADGGAGGPSVVLRETVGTFEVTVLEGGTATQVSAWLTSNGYQSIPTAPAILQGYVEKGFVFAAIKLVPGADSDEIHPLVFKYAGNEPCVPLELTAVAATENMGVRAFFLGDDRVYPTNYKHVELNPVRLDWLQRGTNYLQIVSRAVDSAVSNGQAFVTEYAGPSNAVSPFMFYGDAWNADAFRTATPETLVTELARQQLASCGPTFCSWSHPLIKPLLREYLPVPAGLQEDTFYGCVSCFADRMDRSRWNAARFADAVKARIVAPGAHARDLLMRWPYLTRLFTTISPGEMTLDPTFHARPDKNSPGVAALRVASQRITCDNRSSVTLPDAREVAVPGGVWPAFSSRMPFAERIEEVPLTGDFIVLVDNSAQIANELGAWNRSQDWDPPPPLGGGGAAGSPGAGASGGRQGHGGSSSAAEERASSSGGGCQFSRSPNAVVYTFGLGALALLLLRQRSRRAA